jgi:hypothetical protein
MRLHIYLAYLFLIAAPLFTGCSKKSTREEAASQKENINQTKAGGPSDVAVDSASLGKYLYDTNEKQELLPGITRFYQER